PYIDVAYFHLGLSLKGNTYWFVQQKIPKAVPGRRKRSAISDLPDFLLCFDFTTERFVPLTLSSVREEQLAVLFQKGGSPAYTVKIWISSKIEPNAVSWNKLFLAVDMKPLLTRVCFQFLIHGGSFFVYEEKEVAVVLDKDRGYSCPTRNIAYIIGKNEYFKQVDLGESK
ncbi:hypothetical protein EUTSA_v10021928mg, partial [Eutrema salsugineum]